MKKVCLSKVLLVIVLSILLIINISSVAFADDFSGWDETSATTPTTGDSSTATPTTGDTSTTTPPQQVEQTGDTSTTTGSSLENPSTSTSTDGSTTTAESSSSSSLSTGSATTTLNTNDDEDDENTENEVNSLAYTGIEDNKVLPAIIVLGAIVAGYSLRKVREYNI